MSIMHCMVYATCVHDHQGLALWRLRCMNYVPAVTMSLTVTDFDSKPVPMPAPGNEPPPDDNTRSSLFQAVIVICCAAVVLALVSKASR